VRPRGGRTGRGALACVALLALAAAPALAATIRVGPGGLASIAEAARLARDGDVVEIAAGSYRGDVAVWTQRQLTIRGVGGQPELVADGRSAEDKAIWVIRDGDFRIDNIAFRGARVPHGNGAGIRFEKGRLDLRRCRFENNEMGILTGNDPDSRLSIADSEFAHAPLGAEHPLKHLLYVGHIARVEMRGSYFHDGYVAHLVKSRARESDLRYNLVWDGPKGSASYEMDFPNGGVVTLIGNIVGQSAATSNPVLISFGAEGSAWPEHRLTVVHNTLANEAGPSAHFIRVWTEKLGPVPARIINNLLVGPGILEGVEAGREATNGNASGALVSPMEMDFRPTSDTGVVPPPPANLAPKAQFTPPLGTRPLRPPRRWLPGALQPANRLP
jgi:hypothetical protein